MPILKDGMLKKVGETIAKDFMHKVQNSQETSKYDIPKVKGAALSNPKGDALSNPKGDALSNPKGDALSNPASPSSPLGLTTPTPTITPE